MRSALAGVGLTILVLVGAGAASADRAANGTEKRAVAEATGFPARCIDVRISTINARWASAFLRRCNLGNGSAVFERVDGEWNRRYVGPDQKEPCRYMPEVPRRIARDLRVCR